MNGAYVVLNEGITDSNLTGDFSDNKTSIKVDKYFNYVSQKSQTRQTIYYQPIFDMLDYKMSLVELYPKTIICEGKNDWYTYKYVFEVILNKKTLRLYPGKGCYNNSDAIRLLLAWGTDFLLFMDGDKPSVKAKKLYKDEFQDYIAERVMTISDIINEDIATEEIFSVGDQEAICDDVFGVGCYKGVKSDAKKLKSKLNHAISILLNTQRNIALEDKTLKKFDKIYTVLSKRIETPSANKLA